MATTATALDLGCGTGVESLELLRQGWRVHAYDQEAAAIHALNPATPKALAGRLTANTCTRAMMQFPKSDLTWAGLSLPFVGKEDFWALWSAIVDSLNPNGVFAGDFFGSLHWPNVPIEVTRLSASDVRKICSDLELLHLWQGKGLALTASGDHQRAHRYQLIARKKARRPSSRCAVRV